MENPNTKTDNENARDGRSSPATGYPTRAETHSAALGEIANMVWRHAPDGCCETVEAVRHLCKVARHAQFALSTLERIRLERLAGRDLGAEATAISEARHWLRVVDGEESDNEVAERTRTAERSKE